VLARVLALSEAEVQGCLDDVVARFGGRHRDLVGTFEWNAAHLADRFPPHVTLSDSRRLLIGAVFTTEKSLEAAALCNPSIVAHPDQTGVPPGSLRFAMSVRAISEGHRSSIGFRTGVVDAGGEVTIDHPGRFACTGEPLPAELHASGFRGELDRIARGGENANDLFDRLGDRFSADELEDQLRGLERRLVTRRHAVHTVSVVRTFAERTYGIRFEPDTELAERVLWPSMAAESHGMEDARFVRFTDDDGSVTYYGSYTAYDGDDISQQILHTADFVTFTSSPLVGAAAANKGLALFPRRIGGRFVALSRSDRETNGIAFSDNLHRWDTATPCQTPNRVWEILQLGNCGSPIETDAGWLVLTHGVGPMRTYSIGAILLDLGDPTKVIGQLREPLLSPGVDEQDGYVPNVVYSCGSLVHAGTLVLPYGIGDSSIGIATVDLRELLHALQT
jgi:predicted GH43/DUF377 family glycosyl hydrolase